MIKSRKRAVRKALFLPKLYGGKYQSLIQGGPKETKGCKSLITFLFINFFLFFLSDYIIYKMEIFLY